MNEEEWKEFQNKVKEASTLEKLIGVNIFSVVVELKSEKTNAKLKIFRKNY